MQENSQDDTLLENEDDPAWKKLSMSKTKLVPVLKKEIAGSGSQLNKRL
jgi:hypothetical protein